MKPNDLGKSAGFTKRDATRLGAAERKLAEAQRLVQEWEAVTGESCELNADCSQLLDFVSQLRERFFAPEDSDGE